MERTFGAMGGTFGTTGGTLGAAGRTFGAAGRTFGATGGTFGATGGTFGATERTFGATGGRLALRKRTFGAAGRTFGATERTFGATAKMFGATTHIPAETIFSLSNLRPVVSSYGCLPKEWLACSYLRSSSQKRPVLKVVYSYRVGHFCQLEQIFNLLTTNMFCVPRDFALQCQSAFGSLLPDPDNDTGNANARPTQDQLSDPRSEIKHVTRTPRCDHFPTKWNLALIENMLHADSEKLGLLGWAQILALFL